MTATATATRGSEAAVRIRNVSKAFPGTVAVDRVGFEVRRGEIHALVGGNGSGKSTIVKILAGVLPADDGVVEVGDASYELSSFSPGVARRHGLHFVHQQPTTFSELTVAENLALGRGFETTRFGVISWRSVRRRVNEVLRRFGIPARAEQRLEELGPATQTMVAIARALQDQDNAHDGVLALDEPTAALPPDEVGKLLDALRRYAAAGQAVLFISHRLDEVLQIADRVTVLRDGQVLDTLDRDGLTRQALVDLLVGSAADALQTTTPRQHLEPVLEVSGLAGGSIRDLSLLVGEGEIVGVCGAAGSGRSTLLRILFGAQARDAGTVKVAGRPSTPREPAHALADGFAYVPEDRRDAVFGDLSLAENLSAGSAREYWKHGLLRHRVEEEAVTRSMRTFFIHARAPDVPIATLSGGNQQKAVLARALARQPRILLLDEPTQGVDIGARSELWRLVREAAEGGTGVLVVSSDLEELEHLCDRVVVMWDGRLVAELPACDLTSDRLNRALHGPGDER